MTYNFFIHHRRSIRLKGYDYAQSGAYYITICTWDRKCLFGKITDGKMVLNELGGIVYTEWQNTPKKRSNVILDGFVVMPNHVHVIFMIAENRGRIAKCMDVSRGMDMSCCRGVLQYAPTTQNTTTQNSVNQSPIIITEPFRSPSQTVGAIVRGFKGAVTKQINELCCTPGSPVWQQGYYEHIVRNQDEFDRIRRYINNNPGNWTKDIEHPINPGATTRIPDDVWKEI